MSFIVNTVIRDYEDGTTIPGAAVVLTDEHGNPRKVNGNTVARKSDAEGRVRMPIAYEDAFITVSSVGHEKFTHWAADYKNQHLFLARKKNLLNRVIVRAKKALPLPKEAKKKYTWLIIGGVILFIGGVIAIIKIKSNK